MARIEETKDWLIKTVWPEIIKNGKLKKNSKILNESNEESIRILDVSVNPIGIEEAYMLTSCHRVRIDYTCDNERQSLYLISKRTPTEVTPENYDAVNFNTLYSNEIAAYNRIIPELMKLSNDYKYCPTYYYSNIQDKEASIVLSDFKADGFQMSPSRINLSLEHILLGVEHVATFHGLGYALKAINKKKFDDLKVLAKESRYAKPQPEEFKRVSVLANNRLSKATAKFYPEIPKDFLEKIQQLLNNNFEYGKERLKPIEPFATLCHGDYLRNNIAFAYDDNQKPIIPKKAMMFDFQTLRYSSPMVDLTTFLTISSGMDVRVPNFDKIFDTYHQKLCSTFVDLTQNELPQFMSKSNMLKEYVKYLPYSLGIASFFLANMHEPNNVLYGNILGGNLDMKAIEVCLMTLGGDSVDRELASLQKELYEFIVQENVDIFEEFL